MSNPNTFADQFTQEEPQDPPQPKRPIYYVIEYTGEKFHILDVDDNIHNSHAAFNYYAKQNRLQQTTSYIKPVFLCKEYEPGAGLVLDHLNTGGNMVSLGQCYMWFKDYLKKNEI